MYEKINYIATQSQTVFSVNYDLGSVDVYVNGVRLASTDFVATSLTSVTIPGGLNAGDIVELVSFGAFTVADTYTKSETDNKLGFKANIADLKEIGVGQTWQDLTASRVSGTTYTNTTGKPIFLLIFSTNGNFTGTLNINGISVNYGITTSSYYAMQSVQIVIPNNNTYAVTFTDNGLAHKWLELR